MPPARTRDDTCTPDLASPVDAQDPQPPSKRRREEQVPSSDGVERRTESSVVSTPTPQEARVQPRRGFLNPFLDAARRDVTPQGGLGVVSAASKSSKTGTALVQTSALSTRLGTPNTSKAPSSMAQIAAASMARGGTANISSTATTVTSKGASQALAAIKNKLEKLSADVNEHEADIEKNTYAINDALTLAEDSNTLARELCERVSTLETVSATLLDRILAAEARMDAAQAIMRRSESESDVREGEDEEKNKSKSTKRKNALQDAVRRCMRSFMHIVESEDLPAPLGGKRFWLETEHVPDDGSPLVRERRLCPDWERSWAENQAEWLLDVAHRIKQNGVSYTKTPGAAELFKGLTDVQIEKAIQTCWKTFVKRYKAQKAEKNDEKLMGKIKGRKRAKAKAWRDERGSVPELAGAEHDYLFQWQYQSTDESTIEAREGVIDPHTDNEGTPTPQATRKVWVSHAPAYRLESINALLDRLDVFVFAKRQAVAKTSNRGNTFKERVRGAVRAFDQSQLPVLQRRSGTTMIPRCMVKEEWLMSEHGQQYNDRAYFADDEQEEDRINAAAGGEGLGRENEFEGVDGADGQGEDDDGLEYV
ncbi:hypothetical protein BN946_scf185033.g2 [Trametes cinnabarina]|uniref:Uncharacterized protein n=1 Tax=Pycnoporus cinnabarinus TaxID=5643 RepID=A0A060SR41_PYCCI|nr:hypothetical protein BN946_scf185033.g2 [Trametes cinnabarina]